MACPAPLLFVQVTCHHGLAPVVAPFGLRRQVATRTCITSPCSIRNERVKPLSFFPLHIICLASQPAHLPPSFQAASISCRTKKETTALHVSVFFLGLPEAILVPY